MRPETIVFDDCLPVKAWAGQVAQCPYHWHDALEILQVLEGSIHVGMGDHELLLRAGDIAIVNAGEPHRLREGGRENLLLALHVRPEFYQGLLRGRSPMLLYCCSAYHEAQRPEAYQGIKASVAHLARLIGEGGDVGEIEAALTDMLVRAIHDFDFLQWGVGTDPFSPKSVERLRKIARDLAGDDEVRLGLRELAAQAGISPQHLSNDIKQKFGMTFQELLQYGRCEQAVKLLLSTDKRIFDIAQDLGFSDPKYLIRHFKRSFGATPSAFRRAHRMNPARLDAQVQRREYPLSDAVRLLSSRQRVALDHCADDVRQKSPANP